MVHQVATVRLITGNPNPPTPAFTKAGAAPGTTAGMGPVFAGLPLPCRSPAPTMPKTLRGSFDQALRPLPSVVKGVLLLERSRVPFASHCPLLLRAFKPAVCQLSNLPKTLRGSFDPALRPLPSVVKGLQACCLPAIRPLPSVVEGVQACRLPALKHLKTLKCSAALYC